MSLFGDHPVRIQLDGQSGHFEIEIRADSVKLSDPDGFKVLSGGAAQFVVLAVQALVTTCAVARGR